MIVKAAILAAIAWLLYRFGGPAAAKLKRLGP